MLLVLFYGHKVENTSPEIKESFNNFAYPLSERIGDSTKMTNLPPWRRLQCNLIYQVSINQKLMRDRERGRDIGQGRSRLHAGSPMWDSIRVSRIKSQAAGGAKPLRHRGCPGDQILMMDRKRCA